LTVKVIVQTLGKKGRAARGAVVIAQSSGDLGETLTLS
jgi:hypothetical protein